MKRSDPNVARVFHALGDSTRRAMLERLSSGPMSVSLLAEPFDMSLAAVVQHLQILQKAGLVKTEKVGRVRSCRIEASGLRAAEEWLRARRPEWDRKLDRLEMFFDNPDEQSAKMKTLDRNEDRRPGRKAPLLDRGTANRREWGPSGPRDAGTKMIGFSHGPFDDPPSARRAPQETRTYFVTAVTAGRRRLFQVASAAELLMRTILDYRAQGKFLLHAFVIMPDHFHALVTPAPDVSLEKAMQFIKGGFSFRLKSKRDVWLHSFNESQIMGEPKFVNCVHYIEQNPVRRGLASTPESHPFGSAACGPLDPIPHHLKGRRQKGTEKGRA